MELNNANFFYKNQDNTKPLERMLFFQANEGETLFYDHYAIQLHFSSWIMAVYSVGYWKELIRILNGNDDDPFCSSIQDPNFPLITKE